MYYGHFDNERREYVITRVDTPASWTNYLGSEELCAVVNQTAGGYLFHKSPEHGRITRFRGNAIPADRSGHYVYLRDDEDESFWTISWQPCGGKPEGYICRHGLGYSIYSWERNGLAASQRLFIPRGENVEVWDVKISNTGSRSRKLTVFSFCEFSFGQIPIDNQNFQMSLYCAGSSYEDGVIDYNLFYEHKHRYMTSSFSPDGYDCLRDSFIGPWRDESRPLAVEKGECFSSSARGGNHCGSLMKHITLEGGGEVRLVFMLGVGDRNEAERIRAKYSSFTAVDEAIEELAAFWDDRLSCFHVTTPDEDMNTMLNIWNLYQSEINVMFSRFASFIEVGGRTGLGYRDTAQDAMAIPHSNPAGCRKRILQLMQGLVSCGYGLHLFDPAWFEPQTVEPFKSPTVIPRPKGTSFIHGLEDACADDALWLVASVVEYIRETGDLDFALLNVPYADGGEGTIYEHLVKIIRFSSTEVGANRICKGLRADWNDCLNLGGGESAMVSFLLIWALNHLSALAWRLGKIPDALYFSQLRKEMMKTANEVLWDGEWYIRGITADGRRIGCSEDREGRIHLESNVWAVFSGAAGEERGRLAMDSVYRELFTPFGIRLNAPSYTVPDDGIGFITRVYPGVKENGSIFSHPNPWAWCAETALSRGSRAMEYYSALCPAKQNGIAERRVSEPYSYCQFIMGPDHASFGQACHPFMTGSAGWAWWAATKYILGIRPDFDSLIIDPCIPAHWKEYFVVRKWRRAWYRIRVQNPDGVEKGVKSIHFNGNLCDTVPVSEENSVNDVLVVMGER